MREAVRGSCTIRSLVQSVGSTRCSCCWSLQSHALAVLERGCRAQLALRGARVLKYRPSEPYLLTLGKVSFHHVGKLCSEGSLGSQTPGIKGYWG